MSCQYYTSAFLFYLQSQWLVLDQEMTRTWEQEEIMVSGSLLALDTHLGSLTVFLKHSDKVCNSDIALSKKHGIVCTWCQTVYNWITQNPVGISPFMDKSYSIDQKTSLAGVVPSSGTSLIPTPSYACTSTWDSQHLAARKVAAMFTVLCDLLYYEKGPFGIKVQFPITTKEV